MLLAMEQKDAVESIKRVYAKCSLGLHTAAKIAAASARPPMKLEDYAAQALREKLTREGVDVEAYECTAPDASGVEEGRG
jgi:hypothetical protein